jgi:hypothetical protein
VSRSECWVKHPEFLRFRKCAYVLWDFDRLVKYNMLNLFKQLPETSDPPYTSQHEDDMRGSFDERSKIWQKGGSGYWSKDDTSRIVLPGGRSETCEIPEQQDITHSDDVAGDSSGLATEESIGADLLNRVMSRSGQLIIMGSCNVLAVFIRSRRP